jgi:metal-sulfur cluster biosynthetic enzyme
MSDDIKTKLETLDEVNQAFVEVTFDPPWNPEMITDEAKEKLGLDLSEPKERKEPEIETEWE